MSLLFETIKVIRRTAENIDGHNERVARSRRTLLGLRDDLDLRPHIVVPQTLGDGIYRCRVVYAKTVESVEFLPYRPPSIHTVQLVNADHIRYNHKFIDREAIKALVRESGSDDIIMVVDGRITDFSLANIAFFDGHQWVTPDRPMLEGTKRNLLFSRGVLRFEQIAPHDLSLFSKAAPINAMLDIGDVPFIDVDNIRL
ncbi:MAG: aminotransferase class IV [Ignavibacteria bacterium]|nr:aminotransferase class IV [Ignavibacteria bacterium]